MVKKIAIPLMLLLAALNVDGQIIVTRAQNTAITKDFYIFIDNIPDNTARQQIIQSFQGNSTIKVFQSEIDTDAPLIITKSGKGLVKDNAGRDCLIGIGGCALGMLFVQATGNTLDPNNPPTGFYATVGDKYVQGGGASFVGAVWLGSCIFGVKGIVELFRPSTKEKTVQTSLTLSSMTTEKIISQAMLFKAGEQEFTSSEVAISDVVAYINTQLY